MTCSWQAFLRPHPSPCGLTFYPGLLLPALANRAADPYPPASGIGSPPRSILDRGRDGRVPQQQHVRRCARGAHGDADIGRGQSGPEHHGGLSAKVTVYMGVI